MLMGKLLIVGGTGFFGKSILHSYFTEEIQRHGIDRIAVVSRHASDLRGATTNRCRADIEFIDCDVRELTTLLDADIVIHAAASSDARRYRSDPIGERSIIVDGTRRILELVGQRETPVQLLYVSSGAVYGPQPTSVLTLAENAAFADEPDPAKRAYMDAKRTAEALVLSASRDKNIAASIARCFAFVGPALPLNQHFAIGNFIGDAVRRRPIAVTATRRVIRSYMFSDDLVDWLLAVAKASSTDCPIFNVGSDEAVCVRDLAVMIGEIADVDVTLPDLAEPEVLHRYVPSTDRARARLGVSTRFSLRRAIEETLRRQLAQTRTLFASRITAFGAA